MIKKYKAKAIFYVDRNMKKRAFTLFEVVLALIIFSMIVGVIFAIYINMQKSQVHIKNEQLIIQDSSDFLDQLNNLSFDYTIDYEEYFNRSMV